MVPKANRYPALIFALSLVVASGCAPMQDKSSVPAASAAPAAPAATAEPAAKPGAGVGTVTTAGQAVKKGGTIRFGQMGGVLNFDAHRLSQGNYPMLNQLYNTLVRYNDKLEPQPELAESWKFSADARQLEMKLRQGVKFHNGREFTSADVQWNIARVQDEKTASHMRPLAMAINKLELPDKYTVVFHFSQPTPAIMDLFDTVYIGAPESGDMKASGIGTGPFKFGSWSPGDKAVFKRNPEYWRQGLPYVDEVILQVVPDAAALVVNLEAGALDMATQVPHTDVSRLQKNRDVQALPGFGGSVVDIMLNVSQPPFDNVKVRQAINHALDRKRFVDTVFAGVGESWCQPFPQNSLGYVSDLGTAHCEFNLEKAKQLLTEAGYPNGFEVVLYTSNATYGFSRHWAQIVQQDLAKIGVKATIQDVDPAKYRDLTWGTTDKFAMVVHQYGRAGKDPDTLFGGAGAWYAKDGMTTYTSEDYRRLIQESGGTVDTEKRRKAYAELGRVIARDAFTLPIAPSYNVHAIRSYVKGFKFDADNRAQLEEAWLDK